MLEFSSRIMQGLGEVADGAYMAYGAHGAYVPKASDETSPAQRDSGMSIWGVGSLGIL